MKHRIVLALVCLLPVLSMAQSVVVHEQVNFPEQIPAGGYSGITWLGEDRYAVVTDNAAHDGFFVFRIQIDSLGCIIDVSNEGFRGNDDKGHDNEGVAWCPARGTVFISGETDNQVRELTLEGKATGKTLRLPKWLTKGASAKYGLEALTYNAQTHRFWTVSESTLDDLAHVGQYYYEMDKPESEYATRQYVMGVSALTALDDGSLLVLEREFYVAPSKIGSTVQCKIYRVTPQAKDQLNGKVSLNGRKPLEKQLVAEWSTAIGLLTYSLANYEGMCLGPRLEDGRQVIVLIADSQKQYAGVLADWFKTIVIE